MNNRIVITGIGLVTPVGTCPDDAWHAIKRGTSGISAITRIDVSDINAKIAGQIDGAAFNARYFAQDPKFIRTTSHFIQYGVVAADQAIEDAGISLLPPGKRSEVAVSLGSGIGGLELTEECSLQVRTTLARRAMRPFSITALLVNLLSGQVAIRHGLKGPNDSSANACATGASAVCNAVRMILCQEADMVVAGASDAAITRIGMAGFDVMNALSTKFNNTPHVASRPWDKQRDGFVMGEGAGAIIVESLASAIQRNTKIYAEIVGYGCSGDAHHIASPEQNGDGAFSAMMRALSKAGLTPDAINYLNAHGTSTPLGDLAEIRAVKRLFQQHTYSKNFAMSSTKSSTGHLLGAAGIVELVFSVLALNDGVYPPTLNLHEPDQECDGINMVPLEAQQMHLAQFAMSNSFGFGGTNVSLIVKKHSSCSSAV